MSSTPEVQVNLSIDTTQFDTSVALAEAHARIAAMGQHLFGHYKEDIRRNSYSFARLWAKALFFHEYGKDWAEATEEFKGFEERLRAVTDKCIAEEKQRDLDWMLKNK
jgi:hypothetical protein